MAGGNRGPGARLNSIGSAHEEITKRRAQLRREVEEAKGSAKKRLRSALIGIGAGFGIMGVGAAVTWWALRMDLGWMGWAMGLGIVGLGVAILIFMGSDDSKNKGYRF
jgi:hypothetical protein